MPPTSISTIDPVRHIPLPVVAESNVMWSSGSRIWDGLTVELHSFDDLDTPEFAVPDYSVIVQISRAIKVESKRNDTVQDRLSRRGNIWIYSAAAPRQIRSKCSSSRYPPMPSKGRRQDQKDFLYPS